MFEAYRPTESLSEDGSIIVDYIPNDGDAWLAEDHVDPSDPSIGFFPTETSRPMESLDDGGIIIIGGFPAETVRPMESLDDGGIIIIGGVPTETIRPTESLDDGGIIIIGGFPTAGEDRSLVIDWFV